MQKIRRMNKTIGVLLTAIIILLFCSCSHQSSDFSNTPETIAQVCVNSIFEGNAHQILDLLPDSVINHMIEESGLTTEQDLETKLGEQLCSALNTLNTMGIKVEYRIGSAERKDNLSVIQRDYQQMGLTVTDVNTVPILLDIYKDEELQHTLTLNIETILVEDILFLEIGSILEWINMVPKT